MKKITPDVLKLIPLAILAIPIAFIFNLFLLLLLLVNPRSWQFDSREAGDLLEAELAPYRRLSHAECTQLIKQGERLNTSVASSRGIEYQIEIDLDWEDRIGDSIRVLGSIDDGLLRAYMPLTKSFVVLPPVS